MPTRQREREQDRLVSRITGALKPEHLVDTNVLGRGPAATAVTVQSAIADRKLLGPSRSIQLVHPFNERVHRRSHDST